MDIIHKAAELGGDIAKRASALIHEKHTICIYISNGTHVPFDRKSVAGEVSCPEHLPSGRAGVLHVDGEKGGAVAFDVGGERMLIGARNPKLSAPTFSLEFTQDKGRTANNFLKTLQAKMESWVARSCVQGETVAANASHVSIGHHSVLHVIVMHTPKSLRDSSKRPGTPVFGGGFVLEGFSSTELLLTAEWSMKHGFYRIIGCIVFLMEYMAAQARLDQLHFMDRLFVLDLLIQTFVTSGILVGRVIATESVEADLSRWRTKAPAGLADAAEVDHGVVKVQYSAYQRFSTEPQEYLEAAMVLLKTTALQCFQELGNSPQFQGVDWMAFSKSTTSFGDISSAPSRELTKAAESKSKLDFIDNGYSAAIQDTDESHDMLWHQHLSGNKPGENSSATLPDNTKALMEDVAFVDLLMSVVRRSIHDSVEFTIRVRAVFETLRGLMDEADKQRLEHYRNWVPAMVRTFTRPPETLGTQLSSALNRAVEAEEKKKKSCCRFFSRKKRRSNSKDHHHGCAEHDDTDGRPDVLRCESWGAEVFGSLDCGCSCPPEQVTESLGKASQDYKILSTNSKSGEFFFFSGDRRFLIKTVTEHEAFLLFSMLPGYQAHVRRLPKSLIVRYAGLFRVEIPGLGPTYFTVMASIFNPTKRIQETFDVKGSVYKRKKKDGENIGKDQDWVESGIRLNVPDDAKAMFCAVHEEDAAFLEAFHVMDYSLLIGVHEFAGDVQAEAGEPGWRKHPEKGLLANGGRTIYFVGVIDFLIGYRLNKQAEHLFRAAQGHSEDASCVHPNAYARRQVRFVREKVIALTDRSQQIMRGTCGELRVSDLSAKQLRNADFLGVSDPYVQVTVGLQVQRTDVIWNSCNPEWKGVLTFPVDERHLHMNVILEVWDEDNKALQGGGDFLGRVETPLANFVSQQANSGPVIFEVAEEPLRGVKTGKLSARLEFVGVNKPAPAVEDEPNNVGTEAVANETAHRNKMENATSNGARVPGRMFITSL